MVGNNVGGQSVSCWQISVVVVMVAVVAMVVMVAVIVVVVAVMVVVVAVAVVAVIAVGKKEVSMGGIMCVLVIDSCSQKELS